MRLPRRRLVLRYPMQAHLNEKRIDRIVEFLQAEGYRDIVNNSGMISANAGSAWTLIAPLMTLKEKPHKIEVSALGICYTIDLYWIGYSQCEEWAYKQEARSMQSFITNGQITVLRGDELKDKIRYSNLEKYEGFAATIFWLMLLALCGYLLVSLVLWLMK